MGSNSAGAAAAPHQKYPESVERIHLEVSPSGLEATVTFNLPENELSMEFRDKLAAELNVLLRRCGIVYGIDSSLLNGELRPAKAYIIARGTPAEDGRDAVVRMYELMEAKPEIRRDGSVDYYDLRLINRVRPGDWLGERIEPTNGTAGMTVRGEAIKPRPGRTIPLIYDRNSVREVALDGKTQLVSRLSGAVCYTNDKISVSNHLEIKGDVGVSTGNIKFDGYLTINGTICDGFSVEASKDIEINGNLGVGSAKSIISTDGSIYIKGGISAKETVEVRAARNIFLKFADNAYIVCEGTAHIGYYSLNSRISAKEVVFDAPNGQAIGGHIKAEVRVLVPLAGSEAERRTVIEVTGFKRQAYIDRLDELFHLIDNKKLEQQKLMSAAAARTGAGSSKTGDDILEQILRLKSEIKTLEEERKSIAGCLKARGDGEVNIPKRIFPNCAVIINGIAAEITPGAPVAICLKDSEIKAF